MKTILSLLILFMNLTAFGQTFYEKAAVRTCDCLKKLNQINNDNYVACLSESFTNQIIEDNDPEIKTLMGTVDGISSILKDIDLKTKESCSLFRTKDLKAEREKFYKLSENEDARNLYRISMDLLSSEKYELGIESLLMALKSDENNVPILDDLAHCYRKISDFDNAIKYYNKSLEIFPEGNLALTNIAVIYSIINDFQKANEYYKKLIEYYPDDAEGYYGLGKNSAMLRDFDAAIKNLAIAHRIYLDTNSSYVEDTSQILLIIRDIMIEEGLEKEFERITSENNIHFTE